MFDPYFTTKRTGSGLGLAIAKNIIEGMGGSIALESRPGDGTEIRIDLPILDAAEAQGVAIEPMDTREAARSCWSTTSRRSGERWVRR